MRALDLLDSMSRPIWLTKILLPLQLQLQLLRQVSSTPLKVDMTFMAVLKIPRTNYMRDLDKMQPLTYMPLFAATEALEIPDSLSWQLKYLQKMYMEHKGYCVVGVLIGIITAVFGLMLPQKTKPANKNQTTTTRTMMIEMIKKEANQQSTMLNTLSHEKLNHEDFPTIS